MSVEQSSFDIAAYLEDRKERSKFVIVEFGHGGLPIAPKQADLSGDREYIGIEAWIRSAKSSDYMDRLAAQAAYDRNIRYLDHALVPGDQHELQPAFRPLDGYNATTNLPSGTADELFMGNVFGDPQVALELGRTEALLGESSRLLGAAGLLVVRETITPHNAKLDEARIADFGLTTLRTQYYSEEGYLDDMFLNGRAAFEDDYQTRSDYPNLLETWDSLDAVYNGTHSSTVRPGGFYKFIGKTAT